MNLAAARPTRLAAILVAIALAVSAVPSAAGASHLPNEYCAASGNYCTKTFRTDGVRKFRIISKTFSGSYSLCVTSADGVRACKQFTLARTADGTYRSVVEWRQHFRHNGPGEYRVSWHKSGRRLGPFLGFHVSAPTAPGVTATTIRIGIHAPLTGPAPLPSSSVAAGKDQYWKAGHKVAGRNVTVVLRDDQNNPSSASTVCRELIQREKVFLLVGAGGGPDEIKECARVAAAAGVPYVSAGVATSGLNHMPRYFALSKTYAQQMPLLLQHISTTVPPANNKVGIIASNTASYDGAVAVFSSAAKRVGYTPVVYRPSKQASDGELAGIAQKMTTDEVTVATPLIPSTQWIKLAANPQVRAVGWHGVGITQGFTTVAVAACSSSGGAVNGSTFFSPWPGRNMAGAIAPGFGASGGGDDVQWALWGLNKTLHAAFKKMGSTVTRAEFSEAMTGPVSSGIYPNLNHTQDDHFRAAEVHQVKLDCTDRRFKSTEQTIFKTSFP